LKILFFIEDLNSGGKERRLVELIKGLSNYPGVEMAIVLTRDIIHYKDILSTDIKIFYVKRKEGLKKDYRVFYQFYKITKSFKPDIIHVWGNLVAIYAIPTKILLRIPMINNQITDAPLKVSNSFLSHKLTFPFSDRIISNTYAGLQSYDASKSKSLVIYNGFNFKRIGNLDAKDVIRRKFGIDTRNVVGMVATFSVKKDYKTYIEAANKVLTEYKDITFLCIGSGNSESYELMVKDGNKTNILFLGKQNNIESIMNICDIGVLMTNSKTHGEGISNALLEFSALGKPIIASKGGGSTELIEHNKTGYLVDTSAVDQLANKLLFLIRNKDKRKNMGDNAIELVKDKFSIQKMIILFDKEYTKSIKTTI